MSKWNVEIRRWKDRGVEKTLGPYDRWRSADRVDDGLNVNLNHDEFYTVIMPVLETEE